MEDREILRRFKSGTLERRRAVALLTADPTATAPPEPLPATPPTAPRPPAPCAVIALQGHFPQAVDLTAFWHLSLSPTTPPAQPMSDPVPAATTPPAQPGPGTGPAYARPTDQPGPGPAVVTTTDQRGPGLAYARPADQPGPGTLPGPTSPTPPARYWPDPPAQTAARAEPTANHPGTDPAYPTPTDQPAPGPDPAAAPAAAEPGPGTAPVYARPADPPGPGTVPARAADGTPAEAPSPAVAAAGQATATGRPAPRPGPPATGPSLAAAGRVTATGTPRLTPVRTPGAGPSTGIGPTEAPGPSLAAGPGTAPGTAPGVSPGAAPGVAPGVSPGAAPGAAPGVSPGAAPGAAPGVGPGAGPNAGPGTGIGPATAPGASLTAGPGAAPGASPGAGPDTGTGPTAAPGASPAAGPGATPGTAPGASPNSPAAPAAPAAATGTGTAPDVHPGAPGADTAPTGTPGPGTAETPASVRAMAAWATPPDRNTPPAAGPAPGHEPATVPGQGNTPGTAPIPDQNPRLLNGVAAFDPDLFGLDPATAAALDPQERLLLESARQVLEGAGYAGARLDALGSPDGATASRSVGVFTAVTSHDYSLLAPAGTPYGDPAGRLSRLLDLRGPSQSVDTGASSFLTAVHHALAALRAGECAAALVGAAELRLHPGRLRPGDGEGVAAVLLRPLSAARADGDRVQAVVLSSAVGHPGRGPHAPLRERLAQRALATARIPAAAVALTEDSRSAARSVGRAGAATGAAALARAVLQLRHATLLPDPARSGGRAQPAPWPAGAPRRALVGVHEDGEPQAVLVLAEAPAPAPAPEQPAPEPGGGPRLVLLSAPTPAHLTATAGRLARWLTSPAGAARGAVCDLDAVAGELRSGRAPMDCRLAVVATDVPELASALAAFAAPGGLPEADGLPYAPPVRSADLRTAHARDPLLLGDLGETRAYVDALWRGDRLEQLTRLWLAGVDVLVTDTAPGAGPRPVLDLPTTASRPRPFWLPAPPDTARAERGDLA